MILHSHVSRPDSHPAVVSLFPCEDGGGVSFTNEEIIEQSHWYAELYIDIIKNLSAALSVSPGLPPTAAAVISRAASVPLVHFLMDRTIRLHRMKGRHKDLRVADTDYTPDAVQTMEGFGLSIIASRRLNQFVIVKLAPVFGLEVVPNPFPGEPDEPPFDAEKNFKNFLFHTSYSSRIQERLRTISLRLSRRFGKIPALSMANLQRPLQQGGLYGIGKLAYSDRRFQYEGGDRDEVLRRAVFPSAIQKSDAAIRKFLSQAGLTDPDLQTRLRDVFAECFQSFFPVSMFEKCAVNISQAQNHLESFRAKTLFSPSVSLTGDSAFPVAAARNLGMTVVGSQHGGHHGYLREHVWALEGEYPFCDFFVTWGWERFEEHPALQSVRAVRLPPPWLCARKQYWDKEFHSAERYPSQKSFDFLLLTNKVYRSPAAPSGAHASVNHLQGIAAGMLELVERCASQKVSIVHKPYSSGFIYMMPRTHERMLEAGQGIYYRLAERFDKGLTVELVKSAHVILFDQPGTGFLECAACEIPSMVLWNRLFHVEMDWARDIFLEMEKVGVVHRTVQSLVNEMLEFKKSPSDWMNNPERKDVIARFCHQYAWVPDNWPSYWKKFIKALP